MQRRTPAAVGFYRRALKILPARFRRERGAAMLAMFEEEWQERSRVRRPLLLVRGLARARSRCSRPRR